MFRMFWIYCKCAWTNAFTRIGYICLLLSAYFWWRYSHVYKVIPPHGVVIIMCLLLAGIALCAVVSFGKGTAVGYYLAYRRLLRNRPQGLGLTAHPEHRYCFRQGVALAMRDYERMQKKQQ